MTYYHNRTKDYQLPDGGSGKSGAGVTEMGYCAIAIHREIGKMLDNLHKIQWQVAQFLPDEALKTNECALSTSGDCGTRQGNLDAHVANRIKTRREALGLTVERTAQDVFISSRKLQNIEAGVARAGASLLFSLSQVLRVPVDYFFEGFAPD